MSASPTTWEKITEAEMYGYLRTRLGDAAEAVLLELEKTGNTTTYFQASLGLKVRVEIQRIVQ